MVWQHCGVTDKVWTTAGQIDAALAEFEAALGPAWSRPAAHGIAHDLDGGGIVVDRYEVGEHYLSAAVLAFVADCPFGFTGSLRLTAGQLDQAIELLSPAGPYADGEQSTLRAWRYLREEIGEDGECVAAFAGALDEEYELLDDPYAAALLAAVHHGRQENPDGTTTLWRPVGPAELGLLRASGMGAWPPRLPDQPIFYPVLDESYAAAIAAEWNVAASGAGYVTRFRVLTSFARRYPTREAGGRRRLELWIPAGDVPEVNRNLVGAVELVGEFA